MEPKNISGFTGAAAVRVPLCAGTIDDEEITIQFEADDPVEVMRTALTLYTRSFTDLAAGFLDQNWIPAKGAIHLQLSAPQRTGVTVGTAAAATQAGGTLTSPEDGKRVIALVDDALSDPRFLIALGAVLSELITDLATPATAQEGN